MTGNESRARQLATRVRRQSGAGDGPIKDLFEFAHLAANVDVLSIEASQAEHGLSMMDPVTGRAVITVATTPNPMRQRSSIAHELGHVLAGDLAQPEPLAPGERSPQEIQADAFARHLLVPVSAIRKRLPQAGARAHLTVAYLSDLVQEFEASPALIAIQVRDAGLIDSITHARWCRTTSTDLATTYGWLSQYASLVADSERPRAPQGLMARAVEGYRRGVLGIEELALWYGPGAAALREGLGEPVVVEEWSDDWDNDRPLFGGQGGEPAP